MELNGEHSNKFEALQRNGRQVSTCLEKRSYGMDEDALATTDLCDSNIELLESGELRFLQPVFKMYGKREAFSGRVVTLKVLDDNGLVIEVVKCKGEGRVLIIDGPGSMRCALMGGQLAQLEETRGWAGVVVNGCIRDVNEINGCDIGVRALGSHPVRPTKKRDWRKVLTCLC